MIKADGGKGDFTTVTLDTAAYEALYAKRADFVITFTAWEGIEAGQRGIPLRTFAFTDYGFPDFYQVVLACDRRWLDREPDLAKAFVVGLRPRLRVRGRPSRRRRGDPGRPEPRRLRRQPGPPGAPASGSSPTAATCATRQGAVGRQTLERWQGYSGFLFDQGLLIDADGKPLAAAARLRRAVLERVPAMTDRATAGGDGCRPCSSSLALVALWEAYVRLAGLDPVTLPAPSRVLAALWDFRGRRRVAPRPDARRDHRGRRGLGGPRDRRGHRARPLVAGPSRRRAAARREPDDPDRRHRPAVRDLVRVRAAAEGRSSSCS